MNNHYSDKIISINNLPNIKNSNPKTSSKRQSSGFNDYNDKYEYKKIYS